MKRTLLLAGLALIVYAEGGRDYLEARGSGDQLHGGRGADESRGIGGEDEIHGDKGRDRLFGNDLPDTIYADNFDEDYVNCGAGKDAAHIDGYDTVVNCEYVDGKPFDRAEKGQGL